MLTKQAIFGRSLLGAGLLLLLTVDGQAVGADRPATAKLLPDKTVLFATVPDVRELSARFLNSSLGKMSQDPQVSPLLQQVYGSLTESVAAVQERIGLSLPEIIALPQGEVAFALVALDEQPVAPVVLIDAGDQIAKLRILVQHGVEAIEREGGKRTEESVAGTTLVSYEGVGPRGKVAYFEKAGIFVAGMSPEVLKGMLNAWSGEKTKSLADQASYSSVMDHCRGGKDEKPQAFFYADPIGIVRAIGQGNPAMQVGLAVLPTIGLDGLQAVGASMAFDAGQYDSIFQAHVLLEQPRSGVLEMIAFDSGDTSPEAWVPGDVLSYTSLNWKFEKTYNALGKLIDSFRGEGSFAQDVDRRIGRPTGLDFAKEILPNLQGRLIHFTWVERPITATSQATGVALRVKDPAALTKALETVFKNNEQNLTIKPFSTRKYYQVGSGSAEGQTGRPRPCFGVLDNYFLFTDRPSLYEKVLSTAESPAENLAQSPEFKLVMSRITRRTGNAKPAMVGFSRPDENVRFFYELAAGESFREGLRKQADRNPMFKSVNSALETNGLPPFAVLERYLAPSGSLATDDETGVHYTTFTLRRK